MMKPKNLRVNLPLKQLKKESILDLIILLRGIEDGCEHIGKCLALKNEHLNQLNLSPYMTSSPMMEIMKQELSILSEVMQANMENRELLSSLIGQLRSFCTLRLVMQEDGQ